MNIYEKILAIMQEVQYLAKDDRVEFRNTKYKVLSEEKVTSIMREKLIKHKLVVFPCRQSSSRNGQITHVDVVYKMVNTENPEEQIEIASCGDGADSQDKGSGKAMTYAFKYMWLRSFALPTGEDPDKISSAELDARQKEDQEKTQFVTKAHVDALTMLLWDLGYDDRKFSKWYEEQIGKPFAGYEALTMDEYVRITTAFQKARDKKLREAAKHGA